MPGRALEHDPAVPVSLEEPEPPPEQKPPHPACAGDVAALGGFPAIQHDQRERRRFPAETPAGPEVADERPYARDRCDNRRAQTERCFQVVEAVVR